MNTVIDYPAEIIPGRLYFLPTQQQTSHAPPGLPSNSLCYWLDQDLVYEPFCADFGPCNLGHCWRFCQRVNHLLHQCSARGQPLYLLVGPHPHKRANAAALVGIHSVLYLGKRAEEAYAPLRQVEPFAGFRDASCGVPTFTLGIADIIRGMARAKDVGFINWHKGESFDLEEYEHYEQVENGDLNWIVPGKLMAFSGPSAQPKHFGGWRTFTPEDYIEYFREKGVTSVVRLNKKMYEGARFTAQGVDHHELYFPDGSCPTEPIMYKFLDIVEREPGALAVHCKAGLGRTGVLICCYMIKHYGFTAEEAMAYIRVCRPGSVIGPQQHYLMQYAPRLLHEGRALRHAASLRAELDGGVDLVERGDSGEPMSTDGAYPNQQQQQQQQRQRKVINITATSRTVDILASQGSGRPPLPVRRSPRLAGSSSSSLKPSSSSSSIMSIAASAAGEPSHIVSVPGRQMAPASPNKTAPKPAHARGAPVYVHVEQQQGEQQRQSQQQQQLTRSKSSSGTNRSNSNKQMATPPRQAGSRAPMSSLNSTPVRDGSSSGDISMTATPVAPKTSTAAPPSSTKRVLAPNGQPRKIPMAVDFDSVAASVLEDREELGNGGGGVGGVGDVNEKTRQANAHDIDGDAPTSDSWTVSSQPVHDNNYSSGSRVGAFAAAAGRGATAFVEAFRSVVGAHKTSYGSSRRKE